MRLTPDERRDVAKMYNVSEAARYLRVDGDALRYLIKRRAIAAPAGFFRQRRYYAKSMLESLRRHPEVKRLRRVRYPKPNPKLLIPRANTSTAPAPKKHDESQVVYGDCHKMIPTLPDRSVNLVLTSPPYAEQMKGRYWGVPEAQYPEWCVGWMSLLADKLTDNGSVLIVIRPHLRQGMLSDYVLRCRLALREAGWNECEELIWLKAGPPLGSKTRPRRAWEHILWFAKCRQPYINLTANGKPSSRVGFGIGRCNGKARCTDVVAAATARLSRGRIHPAMFPIRLAEQLIATFTKRGDLVIDPFVGSGTTLLAAKKAGRNYWGCDRAKKYVTLARRRLKKEKE